MTADPAPPPTASTTLSLRPRLRRALAGAVLTLVVAAVVGVVSVARVASRLDEARRLADSGRWHEVAPTLAIYLRLWPRDADARLLVADALVRTADESAVPELAVTEAVAQLDRIPDDDTRGPLARLRAARLLLVVLHRPSAAETRLRRAIASNPAADDARTLLWRILDLTRRPDEAEPLVRELARNAPTDRKAALLRRWYLSQFDPAAANAEFDRLLGVIPVSGLPDAGSESARYELFRKAEPNAPVHVAAQARLLLRNNRARPAYDLLATFTDPSARPDPHFVATQARAARAVGDVTAFAEAVLRWPEPRGGYEYFKWRGVLLEETDRDPAAAARSYRRAVDVWSGQLDWQLMHRLSNTLRRLGRTEEAEHFQTRSDRVEHLLGDGPQSDLRRAIADPTDPVAADRVAEFYDAIERPWEAGLWREQAALRRKPPLRR